MRRLIGIVLGVLVVAAAGWSLWWYAGAQAQRAGVQAWLDQQRERGWQAEAAEIGVTGFPTEFRLGVGGLALADPANGWAWSAPALVAVSRPWAPTRIAVTWPPEQVLAVPGARAVIRTALMATLLDLRPGTALELREASGEIAGLSVEATGGWSAAAERAELRIAERPADLAPPNSYDLRLAATAVRLPDQLVDRVDPTGLLQPSVDRLTVIGHAALAEPIGRATLEEGRVALRAATLREVGFEWGEMRLVVSGAFDVDKDGYPVGSIEVEAREWRQMVRLAVGSGAIGAGTGDAITTAIELVTALTGSGEDLSAPLNLSGGKVRIGPFAVADAPRLAPPRTDQRSPDQPRTDQPRG
jgi:hypothetical protein